MLGAAAHRPDTRHEALLDQIRHFHPGLGADPGRRLRSGHGALLRDPKGPLPDHPPGDGTHRPVHERQARRAAGGRGAPEPPPGDPHPRRQPRSRPGGGLHGLPAGGPGREPRPHPYRCRAALGEQVPGPHHARREHLPQAGAPDRARSGEPLAPRQPGLRRDLSRHPLDPGGGLRSAHPALVPGRSRGGEAGVDRDLRQFLGPQLLQRQSGLRPQGPAALRHRHRPGHRQHLRLPRRPARGEDRQGLHRRPAG